MDVVLRHGRPGRTRAESMPASSPGDTAEPRRAWKRVCDCRGVTFSSGALKACVTCAAVPRTRTPWALVETMVRPRAARASLTAAMSSGLGHRSSRHEFFRLQPLLVLRGRLVVLSREQRLELVLVSQRQVDAEFDHVLGRRGGRGRPSRCAMARPGAPPARPGRRRSRRRRGRRPISLLIRMGSPLVVEQGLEISPGDRKVWAPCHGPVNERGGAKCGTRYPDAGLRVRPVALRCKSRVCCHAAPSRRFMTAAPASAPQRCVRAARAEVVRPTTTMDSPCRPSLPRSRSQRAPFLLVPLLAALATAPAQARRIHHQRQLQHGARR